MFLLSYRQETEHWFGEVYIPLAMILPYSKQIVHQDEMDGPLSLLGSFEREITMPVEPKVGGRQCTTIYRIKL